MLVLAHAHRLGVDFDQLGQRVLQTAGNGHRTAQVDVKLGELLRRQLGGRIHRGPRLADHHVLQMQALLGGKLPDDLGGKFLGLVARGAVADGQQLHAVFQNHSFYNGLGLRHPLELRHRVDHVGVQHLAGGVHHRHLAAHAVAGVQPHDHLAPDGRLQQQLAQVVAKDLDGALGGHVGEGGAQLVFQTGMDETGVGVLRGGLHQQGAGPAGLFAGEHPRHDAGGTVGVHLDGHLQKAFPLAPVQRKDAVAGDFVQRLGVVVILGVDAVPLLGLLAGDAAKGLVVPAQLRPAGGIVGNALRDDVLRASQRGGGIGDLLIEIVQRGGGRVKIRFLGQNRLRQRLQAPRAGNAGAGLALGLVGTVQVLHLSQRFGGGDGGGQFGSHGVLLGDGFGDLLLALVKAPQILQTVAQIAQHLIVHGAGGLLAVAGDERDGVARVDEVDGALYVFDIEVQLSRELFGMVLHEWFLLII